MDIMDTSAESVRFALRGAVQIFSEESLQQRLTSGKQLKIKLGADPSRPDLHLGHTVILRRLKALQNMGHEIIFIIGDFTGMIGDPSGKSKTRPKLTLEQTRENGESYMQQVAKILDTQKAKIVYNSEWLNKMNFADVINLASKYTLARTLERDDFTNRFRENQPISLHELLYPLAQGYDSVAIQADVEVGGTDQTFNLLVGRELQRDYGQTPQEVITFPLLVGLDGKEKMSKSLDNYIGIAEPPAVMYEKAMKIPDTILLDYFILTTDIPEEEAKTAMQQDIIAAHKIYAAEIVKMYHGEPAVAAAMERYKTVASGAIPQNMQVVEIPLADYAEKGNKIGLLDLIRITGLAPSNAEARRLVQGKGIKINNETATDFQAQLDCQNLVLSKGKNKFVQVNFT
ncbi:MAG: tyrosine--tRNA ligase [Defluviitaleaceae bacterium]|nr:tyrosine--tRNA ligase [Defluviitaleaceae bacterium]